MGGIQEWVSVVSAASAALALIEATATPVTDMEGPAVIAVTATGHIIARGIAIDFHGNLQR